MPHSEPRGAGGRPPPFVRFIKYHGLGNDFIVVDAPLGAAPPLDPSEVAALCARGSGVGADGVMAARASSVAAVRMDLVNSDGSTPEMCGNGIRCFVKYCVEELGLHANPLPVDTNGGVRHCAWTADDNGLVHSVRVAMGAPTFDRASVPMSGEGSAERLVVEVGDTRFEATGVNTGNPHMVIFGDASVATAKRWGPTLTAHPVWIAGANVEFAAVTGPNSLEVAVWERGCGLTQACGTGATAAASAALRLGLVDSSPITVRLPGGDLIITIADDFSEAWMDGPATEVYRGVLSP